MSYTKKIVEKLEEQKMPLVMVGIMGCGKTHTGQILAAELGLPFIDSDYGIEKEHGKTITEIFHQDGEDAFRALETQKIREILGQGACVLSVGGGAFTNKQSRDLIKEGAISIWLDSDINILYERVSRDSKRPLLQTDNSKQTLSNLLEIRKPFYTQADIHVKSEGTDKAITDEIKKALYARMNMD